MKQTCLKLKSVFCLLQSYNQSATVGLVPLSATIDAISINFLNKKNLIYAVFGLKKPEYSMNHAAVKFFIGRYLRITTKNLGGFEDQGVSIERLYSGKRFEA